MFYEILQNRMYFSYRKSTIRRIYMQSTENMWLPFRTDVKNIILYHHEKAISIMQDMASKGELNENIVHDMDMAMAAGCENIF